MDKTKMMKKLSILLSGTAIASAMAFLPVQDVNASKTQFLLPVNNWQVGVVQEAAGQQSAYCAMANQFDDGVVLAVAKDQNGAASLALDFKRSFLRPQSQHSIVVEIDQTVSRKLQAVATNSRALVVQLGQDDAFLQALNGNGQLDISFAKMRYSFALESFDQSFVKLENCSNDLKASALQPAAGGSAPMVVTSPAQMDQEIAQVQAELDALRIEKQQLLNNGSTAAQVPQKTMQLAQNTAAIAATAPVAHMPKKDPERDDYLRELKQMRVENVALSQQVTEQKNAISDMQMRITGYKSEKQELVTRLQLLEREISAYQMADKPAKTAQDFVKLEQGLAQKAKELQMLRQENLVLQDLLSQKEAAMSQQTNKAADQKVLEALKAEKQDLENRLDALQATTAEASIKLTQKEEEIAMLRAGQLEMRQQLIDQNAISTTEFNALRKERDQLRMRVAELDRLTDQDTAQMAKTTDVSKQTQMQLQSLRQENLILQQQLTELMAKKQVAAGALAVQDQDTAKALKEKIIKIEAQEIELTKLRDELEVMKTAYVALQQEKKDLQVALATAQQVQNAPEQTDTVLMLNELLKEQKAQLADLRQENLGLLQNLTKSEERIRTLELKTADYVALENVPENVSAELHMRKADAELQKQQADLMRMQANHQAQVEALELEKTRWAKAKHQAITEQGGDIVAAELQAQRQAHLVLQAEKEAADNRIAELEANIRQLKENQRLVTSQDGTNDEMALLEARKVIAAQADQLAQYQQRFGAVTPDVPAEQTLRVVPLTQASEARRLAEPPAKLRPNSGIQIDLNALSDLGVDGIVRETKAEQYDLGNNSYYKPKIEVDDKAIPQYQTNKALNQHYQENTSGVKREELPFIALRNPKTGQRNAPPGSAVMLKAPQTAQAPQEVSHERSIVIRKVLHEARIPVRQFNTDSYRTPYGQTVQYEKWNNDVLNGIHETLAWSADTGFEYKSKNYIDRYKEDCSEPLQFRNESYEKQNGHHMAVVTLYCPAPDTPYLTASILYGEEGSNFEIVAMTANIDQEQQLYQYRDQYLETFTRLNPEYQF